MVDAMPAALPATKEFRTTLFVLLLLLLLVAAAVVAAGREKQSLSLHGQLEDASSRIVILLPGPFPK
jgi:hypothetical protein